MLMVFSVCVLKYSTYFDEHHPTFCVALFSDAMVISVFVKRSQKFDSTFVMF